jgi:MFS family permease
VLALGTAQTLAWASSYYLPAMLAAPMARDLGVATPTVFAAFSMALILSALLGPLAGRLIDRHGGRPVLVASNVLFMAGLLLLGGAQGPATLVAAWVLVVGRYERRFLESCLRQSTSLFGFMTLRPSPIGFTDTECGC